MATLSITLTESEIEVIAGIPKFIILEANIPCNIFYTLDGSIPDTNSSLVVNKIYLPTEFESVTLKYFATDGILTTTIFGYTWNPDKAVGPKLFAKVKDVPIDQRPQAYNLYPYGTSDVPVPGQFEDTALEPVDAPDKANVDFQGYDANQAEVGFLDKPFEAYPFIAPPGSGERPNGLGRFGQAANIIPDLSKISQFTSTTINRLFNPRAMVQYQDGRDPNVDPEISAINKQFFFASNLESPEGVNLLITPASEGTALGGSFLKYYINQKEQTITFYYFDSQSGRWIISTEPYNMSNLKPESLAHIIFAPGERHVYRWVPFVTSRYI